MEEILAIRNDKTRYTLWAEVKEGELHVAAQDLSPGLEEIFGQDEYEYSYAIGDLERLSSELVADADPKVDYRALGRDRMLVALVRDRFAVRHGLSATTELKRWLVAREIPFRFWCR